MLGSHAGPALPLVRPSNGETTGRIQQIRQRVLLPLWALRPRLDDWQGHRRARQARHPVAEAAAPTRL